MSYQKFFNYSIFLLLLSTSTNCLQRKFIVETTNPKTNLQNQKQIILLKPLIKTLILATINKDSLLILQQIHPQQGAFIDIKAAKSYSQIKKEISDKNSYLYSVLFDSEALQKKQDDAEIKSISDYLSPVATFRLYFSFNTNQQCEIHIDFKDRPSLGLLGNPIYEKIKGKWYLRRIF